MWPDFGRRHRVTTKTTCTATTMTATVTTTTTTATTTTTGRGLGIRGVNWKWATATTFPQSDARCNFSHELAGQKAGSQGCQRHGEEGRGRPDLTLFQFHPGFHPIVSRSPACQRPSQQISTAASHRGSESSVPSGDSTYSNSGPQTLH